MRKFGFSARAAIVCSLILAIGVPSVAMGFGEGRNLLLGKRNPSSNGGLALTSETEIIGNTSTYVTRQSNKKDGDGGGAIYGCRSNPGTEPCIRSNNLKGGRAFEFSTVGNEAGRIETGNPSGAPFTTNATGVATGLNADKVDGKDAADFATTQSVTDQANRLLFAVVADPGGSGTPTATGPTNPTVTETTDSDGNAVYTVDMKKDVSKCSFTANMVVPGNAPGVSPGSSANLVSVNLGQAGTPATPTRHSFHLQVIC